MNISKVAKATGLSAKTIRYYKLSFVQLYQMNRL